MRQLPRIASIAALFAALCGCGPVIPTYQLAELPSGRTLKILGLSEAKLEGDVAGLRLSYETDLALDDRAALYREVEAIWDEFRFSEVVAGKSVVLIKATTPEQSGWSRERRAVEYTFQLGPEGSWSLLNPGSERAPS